MDILNAVSIESNSQIKINFDGGDLSLLFTGWGKVTKSIKIAARELLLSCNGCPKMIQYVRAKHLLFIFG